jgi:hypothetical protein
MKPCPQNRSILLDPEDPNDPLTLQRWRMKDGSYIQVECMDDEHIDRTIKMLCRTLDRWDNPPEEHPIKRAAQRTVKYFLRHHRAWIERFTFELAERALGRRHWRKTLSYILAQKIYDAAVAAGATPQEASKRVAAARGTGPLSKLFLDEIFETAYNDIPYKP